jgi:hypothetical protein
MMSDDQDLLVEFDTLRQASLGISQTIDAVRKLAVSKIVGPNVMYGHDGVHGAFADFCSRWDEGVGELVKDGDSLSDGLKTAVDQFLQGEGANVRGYTPSYDPSGGH